MNSSDLAYLATEHGATLLRDAASQTGELHSRITKLRRSHPQAQVSAAIALLDLRRRASARFSQADRMFFTPEAFEQSTGETIARWRAGRFPTGGTVLDLCCGIGGDAVQLARRGYVLAVDRSPECALCTKLNAEVYSVADSLSVLCADVSRLSLRADAAFFDPSRRVSGRRVRSSAEYSPPLALVEDIRRSVPNLAVKVSPALDDSVLESLGGRIEFVSDRGECKEAVVWFGSLGLSTHRAATVLPKAATLAAHPHAPEPELSPPGDWLFEPDPAVIRAHLIAEIAEKIDGRQLDRQIAYLTMDAAISSPFGTAYRVIEWLPFSLSRIQKRITALKARAAVVKRRGVPMEPEDIFRKLKSGGDRPVVVVLTRVAGEPAAIICEPTEPKSIKC